MPTGTREGWLYGGLWVVLVTLLAVAPVVRGSVWQPAHGVSVLLVVIIVAIWTADLGRRWINRNGQS